MTLLPAAGASGVVAAPGMWGRAGWAAGTHLGQGQQNPGAPSAGAGAGPAGRLLPTRYTCPLVYLPAVPLAWKASRCQAAAAPGQPSPTSTDASPAPFLPTAQRRALAPQAAMSVHGR